MFVLYLILEYKITVQWVIQEQKLRTFPTKQP